MRARYAPSLQSWILLRLPSVTIALPSLFFPLLQSFFCPTADMYPTNRGQGSCVVARGPEMIAARQIARWLAFKGRKERKSDKKKKRVVFRLLGCSSVSLSFIYSIFPAVLTDTVFSLILCIERSAKTRIVHTCRVWISITLTMFFLGRFNEIDEQRACVYVCTLHA